MPAPKEVLALVQRFEVHRESYASGTYNEAQLRREFLDPLFAALGWDVENKQGYAEAFKDVIYEDAIKIGGFTKAPDYSFRIGGVRQFFVEAKKPSVDIKGDPAPAYQLRRYGWSAKLPVSVLTDFEEFAVYDCRVRPLPTDKPATARILYLRYTDYAERWDDIASVFSRDAILRGSFEKFVEGKKGRRGTAEVDAAFLAEIESWRELLAKHIAKHNHSLSTSRLNFAVQQTIDRLIFLRICEDRGIETYGRLQALENGTRIYARLSELFTDADARYNSGLFHFRREKGREEKPDEVTLGLKIEDEPLKHIIRNLYYPDSPYEFSVLPADILGQVYERFLGKVIRLTTSHRAVVEEKPEVKKAGGVYYTPSYIVQHIVSATLAPVLERATPKQAAQVRVVDPACGSGSFLISAYQYLLDWHLNWYVAAGPAKHRKEVFEGPGRRWRLTTTERRRILQNSIFGVDIDPQAVEVTKLSLLLKVLEGETHETLQHQFWIVRDRALPDLSPNIRCGNSLVGPDYRDASQLDLLDSETEERINAFDWSAEFNSVFAAKARGFTAVIGNPPYAYRNATEDSLRPYYLAHYKSAEGNYDLYKFFLERSINLLAPGGRLGMIVSASFLVQPSFTKLRRLLVRDSTIERLAPLGPNAFAEATVDTAIVIARREPPETDHRISIRAPTKPILLERAAPYEVRQARFNKNPGSVFDYRLSEHGAKIVDRLVAKLPTIEHGYEFGVGINTGFIKDELVSSTKRNSKYHRMVAGDGISRYGPVKTDGWILYDPEYVQSRGELGRTLPAEHLLSSAKILVVRTRNLSLERRIVATIDDSAAYNLNRLSNIVARPGHSLLGLLAILNSALFNWLFSTRFYDYEIKPVYLRSSPLADSNDASLIRLVEEMLRLSHDLDGASGHSATVLERRVAACDAAIDERVFELYGLGSGDIDVVRSSPTLQTLTMT